MSSTSYANEDSLIREFNIIDFSIIDNRYKTAYIDVSKYKSFTILGNTDFGTLFFEIVESTNGSGDTTKELVTTTPTFAIDNVLFNFGTYNIRTRYLSIIIDNFITATVNLQLVFTK